MSDPIYALAVPHGRGALHVHRISGVGCLQTLACALRTPGGRPLAELPAGARYLYLIDSDGTILDDVVVTAFEAPRSYTGEDVVEISSHGNPLITARLQARLRALGLREALPGEFTQRAFLNGKLDLARAEAVNLLIHAETCGAVRLARAVSEGGLTRDMTALRGHLVRALAYLEAHIDFADDEVGALDPEAFLPELRDLARRLTDLAATYERGRRVREGLRVVLCGAPNAGKSTLFNALLRSDRAIVTHIAGTTRDVLEERLVVDGRDFVISDTAGLRDTDDVVERMGVERSRKAIAGADLACVIVDGSQGDGAILKALEDARTELRGPTRAETLDLPLLVVVTKADLWALDVEEARRRIASLRESDLSTTRNGVDSTTWTFAGTADSLEEGDAPRNGGFRGTSEMESVLVELCDKLTATPEANAPTTLISTRQRDAVVAARARVVEAVEVLSSGGYPEAAASLLLAANRALVEVVGDISAEDVLGSIFSTFCIGK